jgi:hypothetical protein
MSDKIAVYGMLTDVRNLAAHKSIKLTIEIPAELAASVVEAFGWPTGVKPVPVAVAAMDPKKMSAPSSEAPESRQRSLSQQAGMKCQDAVFRAFMGASNADECADMVRSRCGVTSRADIRVNTPAGRIWAEVMEEFAGWKRAEECGADEL